MTRQVSRGATVVAVVLAALVAGGAALAYWVAAGSGIGGATTGTLSRPGQPTASVAGSTVTLQWAASAISGGGAITYFAERQTTSADWASACNVSSSSGGTLSCAQFGAPAGSQTYRVRAVFRSWSDTSPPSDPVTVTQSTLAITSPSSGARFEPGSVSFAGTASDTATVTISFARTVGGSSPAAVQLAAPVASLWTASATFAVGDYTATATQTSAQGPLTSNAVNFTVAAADTVAPTVSTVSSTTVDGFYGPGVTIPVTVTFNEPVFATGTPKLAMATGAVSRDALFASGGGTNKLTFNYVVQTGDATLDLDYSGTTSLTAGTIKDAAGNDANRTLPVPGAAGSLGSAKGIKIDGTAPFFVITATGTGTTVGTDGSKVYFRPATPAGTFTLTATDPESNVSGTPNFPSFTGWSSSGTGNARTYSRTTASASASASGSITNGAGTTSTPTVDTVLQPATPPPAALDIQGSGNGNSTLDSGDVLTLTFNTVINPATVKTGWTGTSTQVVFNPANGTAGGANDSATVTGTSLGPITLGGDYIGGGTPNSYTLTADMVMVTNAAGRSVVTITLTSSDAKATASAGNKLLQWATTGTVRDWGNTAATTTAISELGTSDADF